MDPAVEEALQGRRLGLDAHGRRKFTVSRGDALRRLREQPRSGDWDWTLDLLRAANVLSGDPAVELRVDAEGELQVVELAFVTPDGTLEGLDLGDLLAGALDDDVGLPIHGSVPDDARQRRWRFLVGSALNHALAAEPHAVEVRTGVGGRRYERRTEVVAGRDPYAMRLAPAVQVQQGFTVRLESSTAGFGTRIGNWIRGRGTVREQLYALWGEHILQAGTEPLDPGEEGLVSVAAAPYGLEVSLGQHAKLGWLPHDPGSRVLLVRDGVHRFDIGDALREAGVGPEVKGWLECPSLSFTADGLSVVRDAAWDLLVAWLLDMVVHAHGEGHEQRVHWPERMEGAPTASGRYVPLARLQETVERGGDIPYVWPHRARAVPNHARARVVLLWPSEHASLREALPSARFVPIRALGDRPMLSPMDLTSLELGSFAPLPLAKGLTVPSALATELKIDVDAYVHRYPTATQGSVVLLAYGRKVATIRSSQRTVPGLSLVCHIETGTVVALDALRSNEDGLGELAGECASLAEAHEDDLVAHVMSRGNPWEIPYVRKRLDELDGVRAGVRYEDGHADLRVVWHASALLEVEVGRSREGRPVSLSEALSRLRDVGFVVLAHADRRFESLETDDPLLEPWLVHEHARVLLERTVGRANILQMPVFAPAFLEALPAEQQRHLIRAEEDVREDLAKSTDDPLARARLLGQLLVAAALGEPLQGLEGVKLLRRYDPRALAPTRLVSLDAATAERPRPTLAVTGAVGRGLTTPVIECSPGVAQRLHAEHGFHPAGRVVARPTSPATSGVHVSAGPVRRRARTIPPLVSMPVVHALAAGALRISGDGSSGGIALWARGLRVGTLELPEPLGRVSGRLWLTAKGRAASSRQLQATVTDAAKALLAKAPTQRVLLPPGSDRRRRLDVFIEYARDRVRTDDTLGLSAVLDVAKGARETLALEVSMRRLPLKKPRSGDRALHDIIKQSLAHNVRFETSMLSWKVAKVSADGRSVDLGLRNKWIDASRHAEGDAKQTAQFVAAALVVGLHHGTREPGDRGPLDLSLAMALWRLAALRFQFSG